jgi:hypothetical protein
VPLAHDLRLEGAVAVAGHGYLHRADLGQHRLGTGAVAGVAAVLPGRIVPVIAEVFGDCDFSLQRGLQQPFPQLLEQTSLAGQLQPLGLRPDHQLLDQLVIDGLHRLRLSHLEGQACCYWSSAHLP